MVKFDSLVVGEKGCTFKEVVDVFSNESNSGIVFKNWKDLARELGIKSFQIEEWRLAILHEKFNEKDALHKILEMWKTKKSKTATLSNLLKHLEKMKLNNVAGDLRNFFSTASQLQKARRLFKPTLPNQPNYYIPRTLITRRVIDEKVFSSTQKDVFVFYGDEINRYRVCPKNEYTDTSTKQVRKQELSVRFILLERFGDWTLLCTKTTSPIHLLRHHEGRFHWICTNGDISALQDATVEKNQNELSEEEFIAEIETELQFQTNQPVCISDSPGMGKSLLLANIGMQLKQKYPQRCIAFIAISEFVVQIRSLLAKCGNSEEALVEALLLKLCENLSAREQFIQKITTPTESRSTQVELMFDGFDEVSSENFELAQECFDLLKTKFNNTIRVWVSTRPQHLHKLEKRFSVLGYNIQAFQEKHQIDFLTSFWNSQGKNLDGNKLETFSKNCLRSLKKKLNKKDEDIAGIPLQCMMIAEVYMQEAYLFCDPKNINFQNFSQAYACIDVNSIADLYEKMIKHKIDKFKRTYPRHPEEIQIWRLHMYQALELIFPFHAHNFKDTLQIGSDVEEDYLVNIGILEHRGRIAEDPPRFIHRTFAEYLAARFFVSHVLAPSTTDLQNASMGLTEFLFEHVLECSVVKSHDDDDEDDDDDDDDDDDKDDDDDENNVETTYYLCSFNHRVVCYFLDALLGSQVHISTESCISQKSINYVKDAIYACIHADFGNIIKLLRSLTHSGSLSINLDSQILIDATTMLSSDSLKFLLQNFEHEPLTAIEEESYYLPTVLHAAVRRGNYSIFEYILKEHDFEDLVKENGEERFMDLIHCNVQNTQDADLHEISDRLQILTALSELNMKMINYRKGIFSLIPPLFAYEVHILLLQKLVQCGANLLHLDQYKGTILHSATSDLSPTDYFELLQFIPSTILKSLLQMRNEDEEISLHQIVLHGLATPDILNFILSNGVDINTGGNEGRTCLFDAVKMWNEEMRIPTVKLLLEKGADHTRVDCYGNSIVHISAERGRIDCLQFFLEEKNMNINQINKRGETPIFKPIRGFRSVVETVKYLLERGADYTISDNEENTVLHHLAQSRHTECLNLFAGFSSLDVNARNYDNDTPLHLVVKKINGYYYRQDDFNSLLNMIEKFVSLGADVKAKDVKGETPLDIYQREMLKSEYKEELLDYDLAIRRLLE